LVNKTKCRVTLMKLRILVDLLLSNSQTVSEKVYCRKGNSPNCVLRSQIKIRSGSSLYCKRLEKWS